VLTWAGIPTRCPDSHGKNRRARQLAQEASTLLGGACVFACVMNGKVNEQRGKPVRKQKLALGEQLRLHSHDASLTGHRLAFLFFLFFCFLVWFFFFGCLSNWSDLQCLLFGLPGLGLQEAGGI